jgi:hypothetical protein
MEILGRHPHGQDLQRRSHGQAWKFQKEAQGHAEQEEDRERIAFGASFPI